MCYQREFSENTAVWPDPSRKSGLPEEGKLKSELISQYMVNWGGHRAFQLGMTVLSLPPEDQLLKHAQGKAEVHGGW